MKIGLGCHDLRRGISVVLGESLVTLLLVCAPGCQTDAPSGRTGSGTVPVLDAATASAAGLSEQQTTDAVALYNAKCARCHKFYDPAPYSDAEWRTWMGKMSRKAHLTPEQEELLKHYLGALRRPTEHDGNVK